MNIEKFLRTAFLQNFSGGCFCIILKSIPENRDPGPYWDPRRTLEKPENQDLEPYWDSTRTLEKPGNGDTGPYRDPSRTLEKPGNQDPRP